MHQALVLALRHCSNCHLYSNTALVLEQHLSLLVLHQALVLALSHCSNRHHYSNTALVLEQHLPLLVVQKDHIHTLKILHSMSEFGGLWKQQTTQHALKVSDSSACTESVSFQHAHRVSEFSSY